MSDLEGGGGLGGDERDADGWSMLKVERGSGADAGGCEGDQDG